MTKRRWYTWWAVWWVGLMSCFYMMYVAAFAPEIRLYHKLSILPIVILFIWVGYNRPKVKP